MQLMFRELARLGYPLDEALAAGAFCTYHGDMVALGRGEVLVPEPAA